MDDWSSRPACRRSSRNRRLPCFVPKTRLDPGDHNTRAHDGVRTETHKLIYFWKKDQWECYDLVHDPDELHNLAADPAHAGLVAALKSELYRLKREVQDNDEFALVQPPPGVDGQPQTPGKTARTEKTRKPERRESPKERAVGDNCTLGDRLPIAGRMDRLYAEAEKTGNQVAEFMPVGGVG